MEKARKIKRLFKRFKRELEKREDLSGRRPVFSSGDPSSPIAIVGEAPGRKETELGIPFVGRAGSFFMNILEEVFKRPRDSFYVTNVVKLWPTLPTKRLKTRPPTKEEIEFFLPLLKKELEIVNPRIIICAGRIAFQSVTGSREFEHGRIIKGADRVIACLYHPAYILRRKDREELTSGLRKILRRLRRYQGSPSSGGFTGPHTGQ